MQQDYMGPQAMVQNGQLHIYNGYEYSINKRVINTTYLECKDKLVKQCKSTATVIDGEFALKRGHNHPKNTLRVLSRCFLEELKDAVQSSLLCYRVIYDEVSVRHPTAASHAPFRSVERTMLRWRRQSSPPIPQSLWDYAALLRIERWQPLTLYNGGRLIVTTVIATDRSSSTVYGNAEYLRNMNPVHLAIDATFEVCPRKPKSLQFLTVMARIDDEMLPVVWALMERKTQPAYLAVFAHIATALAPHFRPLSIMIDFEMAIARALEFIYPEASIQRCYFHYCQCLLKRAKKLRLLTRISNCQYRNIVWRKLMALALLPANDIPTAFNWLVTSVTELTPHIANDLKDLFKYFAEWWLNRVTPEVFSVFGLECKTNNYIEAYHRVLRIRIGSHPSIWEFTDKLVRLQAVIHNSSRSVDMAISLTRPSSERFVVEHLTLQRAWHLYESHYLTIPRFLACASSLLKAAGNEFRITSVEQVDAHATRDPIRNEADEINRMENIELLVEEDVDDIPGLHREEQREGREICIFADAKSPICMLCNQNSAKTLSLPCCHWFACVPCTTIMMQLATTENADCRCSICANIVQKVVVLQEKNG